MENAPPLAGIMSNRPRDLEFIVGRGACTACRGRITKCTGERPQCQECQRRQTVCNYSIRPSSGRVKQQLEAVKRGQSKSASEYEEVFRLLQSQPVQVASDILNRIRQGFCVGDILRFLQHGDLRLQLSLVPATSYQFASPYLQDMTPIFHNHDNEYLNSTLYHSLMAPPAPAQQSTQAVIPDGEAAYRIPYTGARMYDARLASQSLRPSKWTSITSDEAMLRSLLEVYFLYEFPFWPCFHKDLFLEDMGSGRGDFCTSFLVNAVLAAACHGLDSSKERAEFWNPRTWSYMFLAETRRLWDLEQASPTPHLATAQGATILGRIYFVNGMDRLGSKIWAQALDMAQRLELFSSTTESVGERHRVSRTITAWAIFSQQSFSCFYLMKPPAIRDPPMLPLPEYKDAPGCFGEIWLKYPLSEDLVPLHIGIAFLALAELRKVMNDIAFEVFSSKGAHKNILLQQAEKHHKTLTRWYRGLPEALQAKNAVLPPHLFLHMQYHNLVTLTFSSFSKSETDSHSGSDSDEGFNPGELVASSKACLATLLHSFYHRHGFDAYYMFLLQVLIQLGFDALDQLRVPDAQRKLSPAAWKATRATLILCAKGMRDQGRSFYLAECVFRILRSKMNPQDVDLLMGWSQMKQEEERSRLRTEYVHGDYPVITGAITQDPDDQRLEPLLESMSDGKRPHVHGSSSLF